MGTVSIKVELNSEEIQRFLRDLRDNPKMIAKLQEESKRLADACGHGFAVKQMYRRRNRPGFIVYPAYKESKGVQLRENRLGRAVAKLDTGRRVSYV